MMLNTFYNGIEIYRKEKIIIVKFLKPHKVISTCRANGGIREDLEFVFNHQSCEPSGHKREVHDLVINNPKLYLKQLCQYHNISEKCASLGTAANMMCASIKSKNFKDLEVVAICTGGVETNAGRVGDPASVYEENGKFIPLSPNSNEKNKIQNGTINIIICISKELTPAALVRSVVTATEAKTAALQELGVSSRYSNGLATGTGTDQIAIACMLNQNQKPLTGAGKHTKLGELIGITVKEAVLETLKLQNGLTPEHQCSCLRHIERFGASSESMKKEIGKYLTEDLKRLFEKNFLSIERDPVTVASIAALVHLKDKFEWNILPKNCVTEVFSTYGAHLSCSVSGKYHRYLYYKERLNGWNFSLNDKDFLNLIYFCFAIGFEEKWKEI